MNKTEMIDLNVKALLGKMNAEKNRHWGNTVTRVVIDSILVNSYGEYEDGATITCSSIADAVRELDNVMLSGSPDCTMTTFVKVYETIHDADKDKFVEHLAHEWPVDTFKRFANGEGVPAA